MALGDQKPYCERDKIGGTESIWQRCCHTVVVAWVSANFNRNIETLFWALTISLLVPAPSPSPSSSAQPSSGFEIKEWPRNLRTDLKGTSIKVALPENALDRPWDDALIAKFQQLTGITVQTVRPGNDTTVVLAGYLRDFASGSAGADVYAIDIVWPGILSDSASALVRDSPRH